MKAKILFSLSFLLGVFAFIACDDDDDPITPTVTTFSGTLNGANEVPVNNSAATGTANFTFNPVTKILSGTVTFSGLTVTNAHIHKEAVGVSGGVVFPLGNAPFTSPISFTSAALTQAQIDDLMNGLYYVNLHSDAYPNGEIRAQLLKSGSALLPTTFTATINGASEVPANASTATGNAVFSYNPTTKILTGIITFTGITPSNAHIHKEAVGVSGGVVFPLGAAPWTSPITFTSPALTAAQATDLFAGLYYVNIHSTAFPNGEIRGQLVKQGSTGGTGGGGGGGGTGY